MTGKRDAERVGNREQRKEAMPMVVKAQFEETEFENRYLKDYIQRQ